MTIFSGVKIVDLSRVFSGPYATLQLANFGAQVIKVEPPGGDDSRYFPPLIDSWSGYYELLNHNKSSITLDLKDENDLHRFYEIVKDADVLVENFSPDVKRRLQVDFESVSKVNPDIIYASIGGVSNQVNTKYYDIIAQAESGFISLNGKDDDVKVAPAIMDAFGGMKLAFAISAALYGRAKTKKGTQIFVSMKGVAFDLLEQNLIETSVTGVNPAKVGNMDNAIAPFGLFKTKNGSIALAAGNEKLWQNITTFLIKNNAEVDTAKFATNSLRLKNTTELQNLIESVFVNFDTSELSEQLSEMGIPSGQVKTMKDVLSDKENFEQKLLMNVHAQFHSFVVPTGGISFSTFAQSEYRMAPKNEHTD